MTESSEPHTGPRRAGAGFAIPLAVVSLLVIAGVVLFTHGESHQVLAEARIDSVRETAAAAHVPVDALMAAIVLESYHEAPRSDRDVAARLSAALASSGGDVAKALAALTGDEVESRMIVDLWERNRERWLR